jgi:hypothetical protein
VVVVEGIGHAMMIVSKMLSAKGESGGRVWVWERCVSETVLKREESPRVHAPSCKIERCGRAWHGTCGELGSTGVKKVRGVQQSKR